MTESKPRGDSARAQRFVVALATVALLLTGVALAVAGGVGPEESQRGSVVIRTVRPIEASIGTPPPPSTSAAESEPEAVPADEGSVADAEQVPAGQSAEQSTPEQAPAKPSGTQTRKPGGDKPAPATAEEEDDDDEHEVVVPSVRDDDEVEHEGDDDHEETDD